MKPWITSLVISVLFLQQIKSQDSLKTKPAPLGHPIYSVGVKLMSTYHFRGWLMAIHDSSAFTYQKTSNGPDPFHKQFRRMLVDSTWNEYKYNVLLSIKVNNKKLRTFSVLSGIVVGLAAGVILGGHMYESKRTDPEISYVAGAVVGGLLGAGLGSVAGLIVASSLEKKYMINGEWKNLEELKSTLKY